MPEPTLFAYQTIAKHVSHVHPVIVDGGANKGRRTQTFLDLFPEAHIHAFEPLPDLASKLSKRFPAQSVTVHQYGLGASSFPTTINKLNRPTLSSILPPSGIQEKYADQVLTLSDVIPIQVVSLDEVLPDGADVVKLDLQGYELEALRGMPQTLARCRAILVEVAFIPLYEGQPLFEEIELFLSSSGFVLEKLYDIWTNQQNEKTAADALFLR
ncbi:FkbM family methyltransferase [Desulfovibrio inopinatus]|uniref:FkbM family methyltransferase n=1 Tax=Desulfovibrio inopinatus TaxID=102109 RepID=UPI000404D3A3|nr:FkbM family methyltransferase [Desulfovibrio inopinatus]